MTKLSLTPKPVAGEFDFLQDDDHINNLLVDARRDSLLTDLTALRSADYGQYQPPKPATTMASNHPIWAILIFIFRIK